MTEQEADKRSIIKILAGSHIHGLAIETSDRDEESIVIEHIEEAMGLGAPFEELIRESPERDIKYFSFRKWCRLAIKGNPNFLLALFAPSESIIHMTAVGAELREIRGAFLSKQSVKSHLGYLQGQRHRMLSGSHGGRGKPRQDKIEEFGYDTKYGMHLIRLALQGLELAQTGHITLPLPEGHRQVGLEIRAGKWPLDEVLKYADDLEAEMKASFDSSDCPLPEHPDYAMVEQFMLRVYAEWWKLDKNYKDMLDVKKRFPNSAIPAQIHLPPS